MENTDNCQTGFQPLVIPADIFDKLYKLDINKFIERRGSGGSSFKASYLSWAHAYRLLKSELPEIMVAFEKTSDGKIAHGYGTTASVHPYLTDGKTRTTAICFPVMDNRFGAIEEPDAREISDACQRGAVKAIAIYTGLGLPLYCGEDIPRDDSGTTTKPDKDDMFDPPSKRTNDVPAEGEVRLYLNVPFKEKDTAKEKGARWDKSEKKWYATKANFDQLKEYAEGLKPATDLLKEKESEEPITPIDEIAEQSAGDPTDPELDEDVPF